METKIDILRPPPKVPARGSMPALLGASTEEDVGDQAHTIDAMGPPPQLAGPAAPTPAADGGVAAADGEPVLVPAPKPVLKKQPVKKTVLEAAREIALAISSKNKERARKS